MYHTPTPPPVPPIAPVQTTMNHTLHLILTLVSCGLWGLVWIGLCVTHSVTQKALRARYVRALAEYTHSHWLWEQEQNSRES